MLIPPKLSLCIWYEYIVSQAKFLASKISMLFIWEYTKMLGLYNSEHNISI